MKTRLYTIYDNVKQESNQIQQYKNDAEALRVFAHSLSALTDQSPAKPDDFSLFCLGTFDTETMDIQPMTPHLVKYNVDDQGEEEH